MDMSKNRASLLLSEIYQFINSEETKKCDSFSCCCGENNPELLLVVLSLDPECNWLPQNQLSFQYNYLMLKQQLCRCSMCFGLISLLLTVNFVVWALSRVG